MRDILDVSVAVNVIHPAFSLLGCIVDIYSIDSRRRFACMVLTNAILSVVVGNSLRNAVDRVRPRPELEKARAQVKRQGFALEAWTPP